MRTFSITTDIAAPPEQVWNVMSDVERWHEWTPSITSVRLLDDGPFRVGTRALVRQPKLPPARWRVTSLEPGRSFTWTSVAPGIRVIGYHAVEATPTGSRATLSVQYSGLFGGLMAMLTKAITERYIGYEARGLKSRSERDAGESRPRQ